MILVVDASVVVKWALPEPSSEGHRDEALAVLGAIQRRRISDSLVAGFTIVALAVVLDRVSRTFAERSDPRRRWPWWLAPGLLAGLVILGRVAGCSAVGISVTVPPTSPTTSVIQPTGDIGSLDGSTAKHFALATPRATLATYCKVVSLTNGGATPGTAQVRCYRYDGVPVPDPLFYFTEIIDWATTFTGGC